MRALSELMDDAYFLAHFYSHLDEWRDFRNDVHLFWTMSASWDWHPVLYDKIKPFLDKIEDDLSGEHSNVVSKKLFNGLWKEEDYQVVKLH